MEAINKDALFRISGGRNGKLYIPDPNEAAINVAAAATAGALGGANFGPVGMFVGGVLAGVGAAIANVSIDAYRIHRSNKS